MKTIVPFSKEIKFNTKLYEILSISLEHELNIKDDAILGDFIVSGEYRSHEISVNKEKFFYRLPFSVEITDDILKESVVFNIEDFNYEICNEDTLKVDIEFSVAAEEIKKEEIVEEELVEDDVREIILPEIEDLVIPKEINSTVEIKETPLTEEPEEVISADSIIDKIKGNDSETYVSYHIHIIKETETIESIVTTFNISEDVLRSYNQDLEFMTGGKILIPYMENE